MREYLLDQSAQNIIEMHRDYKFYDLDLTGQLDLRTLDNDLVDLVRYFETLDEVNDVYKTMCHNFFYKMFTSCKRDDAIAYFRLAVHHYGIHVVGESSLDEFVHRLQPRVDRLCAGG
jgi:hypothetical protein